MIRSVLILLCAGMVLPALAADAPDIRRYMTAEEFQAAGLERLSPAELAALNTWLLRYTAHEAPTVRQTNKDVKREVTSAADQVIRSRIEGEFTGWNGRTAFRLKNGQVWRQRMGDIYRLKRNEPEVEIHRNALGLYQMRIIETGKSVGVSRIE